ncbi:hypothetical protein GA0111570_11234 [Raineyella antarctica]|uniref:Uncharacterized protein n=1 Tax=Raineyella antarctica TaxID=1577474 RepID=A0A1G6HSZ3_9ACTN|nr:hypothetical protein [Raineyella antarctica]SDB96606.1 hypothetical protein GA0111570_11234 [Raineyella antarctica]
MSLSSTRSLVVALVAVVASLATGLAPAYAAPKNGGGGTGTTSTAVGNDVSYPNCTGGLPNGQAFGIVGVNDGLANNTNPCLGTELDWAATSTSATTQPKVALYVNTGNPSGVSGIAWWPNSNTFYDLKGSESNTLVDGAVRVDVPVPSYGACSATNDAGCAYVYGWAKAYDDLNYRGVPDANKSGMWWLDVETANSWESGSTAALAANQADLEAMAAYFKSAGAQVGIYSTSYQWGVITGGKTPSTSSLAGLPNWIPGARTLKGAQSNCALSPFTPDSKVTLTQYTSSFDYDYSCV